MSQLLDNLKNNIAYHIHSATYNPEAEKYAHKQAEEAAQKKAADARAKQQKAAADAAADAKKKAADEAAAAAAAEAERNSFSTSRMIKRVVSLALKILGGFLLVSLALFGASLATNLNVYKPWPYRLLYFFYGLFGFFIVIPYVLLWRWAYKGLRPRFYALFPIVSGRFDNSIAAFLFSWLSFRPDAEMLALNPCI